MHSTSAAARSGVTARAGADARGPRIALSLFGGFVLAKGCRPIAIRNRKAQALFAYLALTPSVAEPRERLCGLLWSESSEAKARASLRQTLHGLRAALAKAAFKGLDVGREAIRLA